MDSIRADQLTINTEGEFNDPAAHRPLLRPYLEFDHPDGFDRAYIVAACPCGWTSDLEAVQGPTPSAYPADFSTTAALDAWYNAHAWLLQDIHGYFNLTYANYLVIQRALLQSMPDAWQARFVELLEELGNAFHWLTRDHSDIYDVRVRTSDGRYIQDTIPHYERGRTHVRRWDEFTEDEQQAHEALHAWRNSPAPGAGVDA